MSNNDWVRQPYYHPSYYQAMHDAIDYKEQVIEKLKREKEEALLLVHQLRQELECVKKELSELKEPYIPDWQRTESSSHHTEEKRRRLD